MKLFMMLATLLIMFAGLLGTAVPVIPGIPLIYVGYLVYGLMAGWRDYGAAMMIFWGVVTLLSLGLDYYISALGARRYGASTFGVWGSIVGAVIGFMAFALPGLIIGTFAGAVVGEILSGRSHRDALRAGKGALLGFLAGTLFKVMLAVIMIGTFIAVVA